MVLWLIKLLFYQDEEVIHAATAGGDIDLRAGLPFRFTSRQREVCAAMVVATRLQFL